MLAPPPGAALAMQGSQVDLTGAAKQARRRTSTLAPDTTASDILSPEMSEVASNEDLNPGCRSSTPCKVRASCNGRRGLLHHGAGVEERWNRWRAAVHRDWEEWMM